MNSPERDRDYYIETMIFLVENNLFKVDQRHFKKSAIFRTTFTLPSGDEGAEGASDNNPFRLPNVTADDFRAFLRVLAPLEDKGVDLSIEQWKSVLHLSKKWEFSDVKKQAIDALSERNHSLCPADRIQLGREFQHAPWIMEGCRALVRQETITSEEVTKLGKKLGWETTAGLLRLRDQLATSEKHYARMAVWKLASDPGLQYHSTDGDPSITCAGRYCKCSVPGIPPPSSIRNCDDEIRAEFSAEFSALDEWPPCS